MSARQHRWQAWRDAYKAIQQRRAHQDGSAVLSFWSARWRPPCEPSAAAGARHAQPVYFVPPSVPLTMPGAPKVALGSRNDLLVLEEALQAAAAECAAGARVRALPEAERQDVEKALKQMTVRGARVRGVEGGEGSSKGRRLYRARAEGQTSCLLSERQPACAAARAPTHASAPLRPFRW